MFNLGTWEQLEVHSDCPVIVSLAQIDTVSYLENLETIYSKKKNNNPH